MQFMVQGAWGVIPAHLTELSPGTVRGLFPGLAYQFGVLIASFAPYGEALLAGRIGYASAMALTTLVVCFFGVVVIGIGRERAQTDFLEEAIALSAT